MRLALEVVAVVVVAMMCGDLREMGMGMGMGMWMVVAIEIAIGRGREIEIGRGKGSGRGMDAQEERGIQPEIGLGVQLQKGEGGVNGINDDSCTSWEGPTCRFTVVSLK